ncbi:polysaccharide deacetylase family protein [Dyadobacter chenwenxiniae]|uniref:Polysaccharide deacetylase family protein n=1 Tax=Dyadobacter chenwenxiniae TaxID=2906456 RepID=A0A9X1PMF7_9BACT|nr:polysaccharide deacetylase family protein [Dyadobacter chenwenxiniae]MCF0062253.1 polysaccharide deacetylase family protein [Dyadobacter chenwenxiniae]UON83991.1 polysaccharide deacetylase family protein [Dyadobacter chenwenxiniae]
MKHNIVTAIAITIFALSGIIFWETGFAWLIFIAIALAYLAVTAYGSFNIQANYFLKSTSRGKRKSIALTFDDGPDPETTPRILDMLREKNVKATFFVIGKRAEKHPELLLRIDEEGHIVGNHSYSHHYLIAFFSTEKLKNDLDRCSGIIAGILGKTPKFFRPPFGVTNPRYARVLRNLKLDSVGWSLRSLDTKARNKYEIINRVISAVNAKDIILLHDNRKVTADSLEDLIEHCLQKGIKIEPLSKLIQKEPYE